MTDNEQTYDPETGGRDMIDLSGGRTDAPSPPASPEALSPDEIRLSNMTAKIVEALKTVYDPEIPVDIYELGLIYKVDYDEPGDVKIEMTLTAPGCPVAGEMPGWVEQAVTRVDGIERCEVEMTFDPPWTPDRMSDEAKLELGWL
ncbi:SUF system Fe-S cluster assembly protein [Parvularcula marina]|nr:SUF system Fe-S cluster assembly protein [Parvularcula marina]